MLKSDVKTDQIKSVFTGHLWQKMLIPLACILGLLFALAPRTAPASGGVSREWDAALPAGQIHDSSPTIADIDGDGKDEIIIGTTNQPAGGTTALVVLEDDGSIKWSQTLVDGIGSTPTVADISSPPDGIPEIIVTTGFNIPEFARAGSVVAFDNQGNQLWRYDTNDAQGTNTPHGNFASPVVGDLDNDGDVEIVVPSWDRNIYLLDHQGNYVWHFSVADTVWSTPVLIDLDGNETLEIVIGTDIMGGGVLFDGYRPTDGGFILILDHKGHKLARRQMNESIYSSPVIADADGDGDLEIFVGSGMYYYVRGNYDQPQAYGFSIDMSGEMDEYGTPWQLVDLPGWPKPVAYAGMSSPALADLDNDGDLEVIIGSGDTGLSDPGQCSNSASDPECYGALYAWHHTGDLVSGFPMWPKESKDKNSFLRSSPTVGDIDGDGELEIAISMAWDVMIIGHNGVQEAALHTDYTVLGTPAIADIDRDGQTNIVIGGSSLFDSEHGHVYNFEFGANTYNQSKVPWPQFHRDAQNSGLYLPPQLTTSASLPIYHQAGSSQEATGTMALSNSGGSPLNFRVESENDRVQFSATSGQIAANNSLNLSLSVNTQGLEEGTHSLGNIAIYDTNSQTNTPLTQVSVTLYLGDVTSIYLPITIMPQSTPKDDPSLPDLVYWKSNHFALDSGQIIGSSPIAADLDGDGMDEIIVASSAQQCVGGSCTQDAATILTISRHDGTPLWSQNTGGTVSSTPAVADINADGSLEVVVTVGTDPYQPNHPGRVIAFSSQGTPLWDFSPKDSDGNGISNGILSSPTLCDLSGNGQLEVIFGGLDGYIYALGSNGELLWEYENENRSESRSTAACADLNSDGRKEVIIGALSSEGGFLYVLSSEGGVLVRRLLPEAVHSSPAVADLDGDGDKEIVVGTSFTWWLTNGGTPSPAVYAFDSSQVFSALSFDDPAKLPDLSGWPQATEYPSDGSPALADLDQDGDMEIVIGTSHPTLANDPIAGAGMVYAWHHNGQPLNGWPINPTDLQGNDGPIYGSPLVADIDQDNRPEVIFSMVWDIFIYNVDGSVQFFLPRTGYTLSASPLVADADRDNKIEIWVGTSHNQDPTRGYLWSFESDQEGFGYLAWPMFRHNATNSGTP